MVTIVTGGITVNVSGYVCNHVSLRRNETLRPLGVAIGEHRQRDPCLKHTYIKTPLRCPEGSGMLIGDPLW